MTPSQVRSEIQRLTECLLENSLALDASPAIEIRGGGETIVTWSNETQLSQLFRVRSVFEEYKTTLDNRWFSALLLDGGMLQMAYTFRGRTLIRHRLNYCPCPIFFTERDTQDQTLSELLYGLSKRALRARLRPTGALRFDYDVDAASEAHPASHLTVGKSGRIPASYPVSVGHFVRFVFSQFYPVMWAETPELREWACTTLDRCLPGELEPHNFYVDWNRGI